jgi:Na+/H+ antiporter NhaC
MEHVKTQLPYAILAAAASLLLFFFAGVFAQ